MLKKLLDQSNKNLFMFFSLNLVWVPSQTFSLFFRLLTFAASVLEGNKRKQKLF